MQTRPAMISSAETVDWTLARRWKNLKPLAHTLAQSSATLRCPSNLDRAVQSGLLRPTTGTTMLQETPRGQAIQKTESAMVTTTSTIMETVRLPESENSILTTYSSDNDFGNSDNTLSGNCSICTGKIDMDLLLTIGWNNGYVATQAFPTALSISSLIKPPHLWTKTSVNSLDILRLTLLVS